mmetsp:Transcript_1072/g.2896  ORF Transcript_1072/g.2896 Transcript_1072/m.2896 type:complete len:452 (+) Transcript_1072:1845-3200(+)
MWFSSVGSACSTTDLRTLIWVVPNSLALEAHIAVLRPVARFPALVATVWFGICGSVGAIPGPVTRLIASEATVATTLTSSGSPVRITITLSLVAAAASSSSSSSSVVRTLPIASVANVASIATIATITTSIAPVPIATIATVATVTTAIAPVAGAPISVTPVAIASIGVAAVATSLIAASAIASVSIISEPFVIASTLVPSTSTVSTTTATIATSAVATPAISATSSYIPPVAAALSGVSRSGPAIIWTLPAAVPWTTAFEANPGRKVVWTVLGAVPFAGARPAILQSWVIFCIVLRNAHNRNVAFACASETGLALSFVRLLGVPFRWIFPSVVFLLWFSPTLMDIPGFIFTSCISCWCATALDHFVFMIRWLLNVTGCCFILMICFPVTAATSFPVLTDLNGFLRLFLLRWLITRLSLCWFLLPLLRGVYSVFLRVILWFWNPRLLRRVF